ncbi:hypothetical protein DFO58_3240 [Arthrobacter sp. AG1021]|nr:hypothetical protein DFO58_3240 [Arthrobacter sp. AG1021]
MKFNAIWPEGHICRRCYQRATRIHGTCPQCNQEHLLPGLAPDGQAICSDCAGMPNNFVCTRCHEEDELSAKGFCSRCLLKDHLQALLQDDNGRIPEHMRPFYDAVTTQPNARSATVWLKTNPATRKLLGDLASGKADLAHRTFIEHPEPAKVNHLRRILTSLEALEDYGSRVERFETWLEAKLSDVPNRAHQKLIQQFATFVYLNRLRTLESQGQLEEGTLLSARQSTTVAIDFLAFLQERRKSVAGCTRQDIYDWLASGSTTRSIARTFVRWAIQARHIPKLDFPYRVAQTDPRISSEERNELILHALESPEFGAGDRAAAIFLLIFGQPLSRIAALKVDQFEYSDDGRLRVTFKASPIEIPPPFDEIIKEFLASRMNQNTVANQNSSWCYPGYVSGEHLNANHLMQRLREAGINLRGAKNAALQELVQRIPPAIVGETMGYSSQAMEMHQQRAGAKWMVYPALIDETNP